MSQDIDYVKHALEWLAVHERWQPELVVLLRPTTPLRDPALVDQAIHALQKDPQATSLRSAHPLSEPPQKMLQIKNDRFTGFFPEDGRPDYFNLPRQNFPQAYHPNGYVDIVRTDYLKKTGKLYGSEIRPFVTPLALEIDTVADLEFLECQATRQKPPLLAWVAQANLQPKH
jgi:CMP-N-acetylneuraminic acid synthetase